MRAARSSSIREIDGVLAQRYSKVNRDVGQQQVLLLLQGVVDAFNAVSDPRLDELEKEADSLTADPEAEALDQPPSADTQKLRSDQETAIRRLQDYVKEHEKLLETAWRFHTLQVQNPTKPLL